jgi:hypothetical protein
MRYVFRFLGIFAVLLMPFIACMDDFGETEETGCEPINVSLESETKGEIGVGGKSGVGGAAGVGGMGGK